MSRLATLLLPNGLLARPLAILAEPDLEEHQAGRQNHP